MASLDDVVTVQKNGVIAVNALVQSLSGFSEIYANVMGANTELGISSDVLVLSGSGRVISVSVITAAAGGVVYDSSTVGGAANSNAICAIPNAAGITVVNFPFLDGLVIKPGSGSLVSISYSQD